MKRAVGAWGKNVWLAPEGINYRGEIWINGQSVGKTAGMFRRQVFDVTDLVVPGETKQVLVEPPAGAASWTVEAWNAQPVKGRFPGR